MTRAISTPPNTRVDVLKRYTGSLSTDYFTGLASGAIGKAGTDISRSVTKFDSSAIGSIGDTLNAMVSAVTGSTSGLSEFTGALSQATSTLRGLSGLKYQNGQSLMSGQSPRKF